MEQITRLGELAFSTIFAIAFLGSLFWGAAWHSKKTGGSFRSSLGIVWWTMVCILSMLFSCFTAFFEVFK